jgi:hypothetical protein
MAANDKPASRPLGVSAEQLLSAKQQELLEFRSAKEGLMEQLGVQTDDELCAALDKEFPGLFPKAH